ncbi:MAG: T9SS type A sorting domain-containing protein [Candidatus Marinimicrobia bacterium]|nr:T9SS type A sorting domain-containing protein [Candidatus Neomarinimicrobiota bacterium]
MRRLNKYVRMAGAGFLLASVSLAQSTDPAMNPFFQPNTTTLYYGSGDVNGDGQINADDYTAMQSGVQNDMADVDGNGTPSTANDLSILNQYLQGTRNYLPGHWNILQTSSEREAWLAAMLVIDPTSEFPYITGEFVSGDYSNVTELNFAGRINPDDPNIPYDPGIISFARFNIPLYGVSVIRPSTGWGHGMNGILTGEDPLNFEDWSPVEPQLDDINVQPGSQSIPRDTYFLISALAGFQENGNRISTPVAAFQVDETGDISLYESTSWPNPDLLLERPAVSVDDEVEHPPSFILIQNYPNPFNPSTTIHYDIPAESMVLLSVYDVQGRLIKTLVHEEKHTGSYHIIWDGLDSSGKLVSTGIYLAGLQAGNYSSTIKMVYLR